MKLHLLICVVLCSTTMLLGQNTTNKIVGIIYKQNTTKNKPPVPKGANVFIPGVGSSTTDDHGYYSISLAQCPSCKSGTTLKIYVNSEYGFAEMEYTIPINPSLTPFDIGIAENNKLALLGIVKDKKTGSFIKGIKVSVVIQNYEYVVPPAITNDQGSFLIVIRKEGISNSQAIQLLLSDEDKSKYKDLEKVVFVNNYGGIIIEMEECTDCGSKTSYKVSSFSVSNIKVESGDIVIIKANGVIRVGGFVGSSGPEGIPNNRGVLGMSLEEYNLPDFTSLNHAVLLYRFGDDDDWKYYDDKKENKYLVQTSGYIQFNINDKKLSDNSGAYTVEVIIRK